MKTHDFLTKVQNSYEPNPSQDAQVFILFSFLLAIYTFLKPAK
ncbi:hypothetical protein [Bacillus paramycoides]|uniref:Uncharacterized protein n=1 Tax=Bacillus paramycoides TaxID=2026194 RepID=A0ABU6MPW0_9BACI|nr:hypothetical protein [Bacillus paramycoides]MED0962990.1 hypothetical protein [Bacillus paramycoides]MED0969969.1 hypothetical protein [Bacillus paramycoides]MED0979972.1 hypothetical protein [Bacillus paramycoides]MED1092299.1 hypothetical protein [Bacillus paramycoides]MED1103796.1 hypothetical protein [Bacillus paramycoides]